MVDGDDKARPGEDVQFAERDRLGGVVVRRRAHDAEEHVAVALEFGPLVGVHGVFHREVMQRERPGHLGKALGVAIGHIDPGQLPVGGRGGKGRPVGGSRPDADPVAVER